MENLFFRIIKVVPKSKGISGIEHAQGHSSTVYLFKMCVGEKLQRSTMV